MNKSIIHANRLLDPLQESPVKSTQAMAYLWSRTNMLKEVSNIVKGVRAWPGVTVARDRGGLCVRLRGAALGHVRWNGRIDLPFGPAVRERLVAEEMAYPDPDQPDGRVVFDVHNDADVERALWLFRLAYLTGDATPDMCA